MPAPAPITRQTGFTFDLPSVEPIGPPRTLRSCGGDAEAGVVHAQVDATVQPHHFPDGGFDGVIAGYVEREHLERSLAAGHHAGWP